jgi:hypothetical protein
MAEDGKELRRWTTEEDSALKMMVQLDTSDADIAKAMKRTQKAIADRRHKMGYLTKAEIERKNAKPAIASDNAHAAMTIDVSGIESSMKGIESGLKSLRECMLFDAGNGNVTPVFGRIVEMQQEEHELMSRIVDALETLALASVEPKTDGGQGDSPLA